jgi:hypothetical protein
MVLSFALFFTIGGISAAGPKPAEKTSLKEVKQGFLESYEALSEAYGKAVEEF